MYIASMTFMYIASMEQATTSFLTPVIKGVIFERRKKAAFATLIVRKGGGQWIQSTALQMLDSLNKHTKQGIHRQSLYLTVNDDEAQ